MLKVATVFSGIGSLEWALRRLNIPHEIVFACDNGDVELDLDSSEISELLKIRDAKVRKEIEDEYVRKTRKTNFVKMSYLNNYKLDDLAFYHDVRLLSGVDFEGKVDLFVGGSPCQSFSVIGKQKGLSDTRGTLFYEFARLVSEIKPKVFIYENVRNIKTHDKGKTWDVICNVFDSLNYEISFEILDAKNFGIPQTRRRMFVVGVMKELNRQFEFPKIVNLKYKLQNFLIDNCDFGGFTSDGYSINLKIAPGVVDSKYYISDKVKKCILEPTSFFSDNSVDLEVARPILSTMHKMHRTSVDNYVTTNGNLRRLTPRESLRLMGFDDTFKICVSDTQMYRQAGNSIVVDVMMSIISELFKQDIFDSEGINNETN